MKQPFYKSLERLPYKLNLQYFADSGEGDDQDDDTTDDGDKPDDDPKKVELTEEELQKKIESESDRKLAKSLEKKQKEWEKQFNERVKAERDEAEKLAKLSQKEREDAEYQKKVEALTKREEALQKQELRASVVNELNEKQLPSSFAEFLIGDDAEKTFEHINAFKSAFDEAIQKSVEERLKGDPPKAGTGEPAEKDPFAVKLAKYK